MYLWYDMHFFITAVIEPDKKEASLSHRLSYSVGKETWHTRVQYEIRCRDRKLQSSMHT